MSLVIRNGSGGKFQVIFLDEPARGGDSIFQGSGFIPQEVRECIPRAKIDISEEPNQFVVTSELPGVVLMDLWTFIDGRILSIYAGVTGEKQRNGEYRYTEQLIGGIRGEITLPERAHQNPEVAKFENNVLRLVFSKSTDRSLEHVDLA